jgi:LuxR family maltose regulon positive regulatory protein
VEITVTSERVATTVSLLREFLCQVSHCGLTFGVSSGDAPADDATKAATGSLRPRERRVLELIERGYSNKEIAREIGVGVETVKSNVKQIFRKLAVDRRMAAVARARTLGLLSK